MPISKITYSIGNKHFKTKNECYKFTSNLIKNLNKCEIAEGDEHFNYFVDLINNHPNKEDKIGDGIKGFKIDKHPTYNNFQMYIVRKNNELISFSVIACCNFYPKYKKSDCEYKLTDAMREAVDEQILEFRYNNIRKCSICQTSSDFEIYHIDHKSPSFQQLCKNFISENSNFPISFDKNKNFRNVFSSIDTPYKNNWFEYHKKNASLQVLCQKCNLTKPKK